MDVGDVEEPAPVAGSRALRACRGEFRFAWEESEELMLEFAAHVPAWRQLSHSELRRHRLLRLNPLWFLCILGCACCILLGHGFHSVFCQGGAVRADEFEVERRARIWWVYCYSGGFVGTVLVDIVALLSALASDGDAEERNRTIRSCVVAILIQLWYMIGDLHLLFRMSRKDTVLMHASAISRVTFGAAFLVTFAIGLLTPAGQAVFHRWAEGRPDPKEGGPPGPPPPRETAITWMIRLAFCLFMVVAYLGYTPLLELDYSDAEPLAQNAAQRGIWKLKVALVAGVVVLAAEGFMFSRGPGLYMLAAQPFFVLGTAYLMEDGRLSARRLLAALSALLPFVVVGSGFAACGPALWEMRRKALSHGAYQDTDLALMPALMKGHGHPGGLGTNQWWDAQHQKVARKDEDIAERDKNILHLQARLDGLEQEALVKDDWCRKRDEAAMLTVAAATAPEKAPVPVVASESKASTEAPGEDPTEATTQAKMETDTVQVDRMDVETADVQAVSKEEGPNMETVAVPSGCNLFGACGA
ncbi:unnamed protein product [Symbiodinium natans]|uniref:Uncharacterized protein n=1 Tax=Symbiodinium natans TaxID=878477 RepID=A0A812UT49_9DINO|nr:unnamed protein product [Symbiodinium natans]